MTVCDGKQMILRCEKPLKIVISDAIYGRMPQDTSLCSGRIPTGTFDWFIAGIWGRKIIGWDIQISDGQRRYLIGIIRFHVHNELQYFAAWYPLFCEEDSFYAPAHKVILYIKYTKKEHWNKFYEGCGVFLYLHFIFVSRLTILFLKHNFLKIW